MSLDGFVLNALVRELHTELVGLRCEKIHQPSRHALTLLMGAKGKRHRLVISVDPRWPSIMLSKQSLENPPSPPFFCLMLRKYIQGSRLTELSMDGFERVVTATFSGRDDLGNPAAYRLVLELTGRHSNTVLLSPNGTVIDALTRVSMNASPSRVLLPGLRYESPPSQDRISPLTISGDTLFAAARGSDIPVHKLLATQIQGMSQLLASELAFRFAPKAVRACDLESVECEHIADSVRQLACTASSGCVREGYIYSPPKARFHIVPLTHIGIGECIQGINALVTTAFTLSNRSEQLETLRLTLQKATTAACSKTERRMHALQQDLTKCEGRDELKQQGDLLYANIGMHRIEGGEAIVVNYYDDNMPEVRIPLDKRLSFADNARQYYRQYARAQSTERHAKERLQSDAVWLDYLQTLLMSIDLAEDVGTLREIEGEMRTTGVIPATTAPKKQPPSSGPLDFIGPHGIGISVGRNNLQNDALVRESHPDNYWLHVQKAPGSHVLVRSTSAISDATLLYAANLAAFYSSLRASTNVPVDYTLRKYVKRPSHARPGYVIYDHQRTLYIKQPAPPEMVQHGSKSSTSSRPSNSTT